MMKVYEVYHGLEYVGQVTATTYEEAYNQAKIRSKQKVGEWNYDPNKVRVTDDLKSFLQSLYRGRK